MLDANMYDAVSAVVIFTDALIHDADTDVCGTNDIAFDVPAVNAYEDETPNDAV